LRVIGRVGADVFYSVSPVCPEEVEAEAILFNINLPFQLGAQCGPLGWIKKALEDG
jgi:hypothetical protein